MAVAVVTMACGCRVTWDASASAPPTCATHQESRVQAVKAPAPRFRGAVRGPCAVGLVVALLWPGPLAAQVDPCTPTRINDFAGWYYNADYAAGPRVPAGKIWEIERAGLASNDGASVQVKFQVEEPAIPQAGVCCWSVPAPGTAATTATPKAAMFPQTMTEGSRLAVRTDSKLADVALLQSGWEYPAACQVRRMFAPAMAGGGPGPPVVIPAFAITLQGTATPQP